MASCEAVGYTIRGSERGRREKQGKVRAKVMGRPENMPKMCHDKQTMKGCGSEGRDEEQR